MNLVKWFLECSSGDYKFKRGEIAYYYDSKYNKIRTLKINHTMSSWDSSDWEYYHCSCIDPKEMWDGEDSEDCGQNVFGQSVCEISQKKLFITPEQANECLKHIDKKLTKENIVMSDKNENCCGGNQYHKFEPRYDEGINKEILDRLLTPNGLEILKQGDKTLSVKEKIAGKFYVCDICTQCGIKIDR